MVYLTGAQLMGYTLQRVKPYPDYPRGEIVARTMSGTAFRGDQTKVAQTKKARAEARALLREVLPDGAVIYPDSPPGVGWVLERLTGEVDHKGRATWHPKRYLRDRETALKDWQKLTGGAKKG